MLINIKQYILIVLISIKYILMFKVKTGPVLCGSGYS